MLVLRLSIKFGTLITFFSIVFRTNAQLSEGSACTVKRVSGTCRSLSQCSVIYNQMLAGIRPDPTEFCGFLNYEPIVCCPNNANKITSTTVRTPSRRTTITTTTRTTTRKVFTPKPSGPRSIARQKCNEYMEKLYEFIQPPILLANSKPVNATTCSSKNRKLIVGGTKADPREFPHMAAIGYNSEGRILWNCGGTLVSEKFVLTAAHCTYSQDWGSAAWVRVGDLNLARDDDNARPQTRKVVQRIRHPKYKLPAEYHDIALLRLEKPVEFNSWVRPACLATDLPETDDNKAVATGWGLVDWTDEAGSDNLLKVTLSLVAQPICNANYSDTMGDGKLQLGIVDEWQLCAGELGKDTCQGDSGGPLAVYNKINSCLYNVIGVTSLGKLCGSIVPGVYTRVYHYVPWLEKVIWENEF